LEIREGKIIHLVALVLFHVEMSKHSFSLPLSATIGYILGMWMASLKTGLKYSIDSERQTADKP
jgi:hypothetical protein